MARKQTMAEQKVLGRPADEARKVASTDLDMTDAQIEEATDKVVHPELAAINVVFLNQDIKMIPLPIFYSKRLGALIRPVMSKAAKASKAAESNPENIMEDNPLDDNAVDAMLDAVCIMLQFYELDHILSKKIVEETATVVDLYTFCLAQVELNGANDFLLSPLRMLLQIVKAAANIANVMENQSQEVG